MARCFVRRRPVDESVSSTSTRFTATGDRLASVSYTSVRMTTLEDAIEGLYVAFAPCRKGGVAGCFCCTPSDGPGRLKSKKLRDVSDAEGLSSYAMSATYTWGTLNDFKHFLPRILQLKAQGELWVDLQLVYAKLANGAWLEAEKSALQRFTRELLRQSLSGTPIRHLRVRDVIESAGLARMDVARLLEAMVDGVDVDRATQLASLVMDAAYPRAWFWWKDGAHTVQTWMSSGSLEVYLRHVFEGHVDHPDASKWAAACDVLEAISAR
jgi:hypothetical protein